MRPLIAALCVYSLPAFAQAEEFPLEGKVIQEAMLDRTLISKPGWLRGAHLVGDQLAPEQTPLLKVILPTDWQNEPFCTRLITKTGGYFLMVEFNAPSTWDGGREARLEFTSQAEFIHEIGPANSGVTVSHGRCESAAGSTATRTDFVANYWNQAPKSAERTELLLHMNISRADALNAGAVLNGLDTPLETSCAKLLDDKALAYNYECRIQLPATDLARLDDPVVTFSHSRLYRGRISDTRIARIAVGTGQ